MSNDTDTTFPSAQATAEWWADRVFGEAAATSGDGMIDVLAIAAGAQGNPAPASKRGEFVAALSARVNATLLRDDQDRFGECLSVDYGPEGALADVSRTLGLRGNFPWKTMTWTHRQYVTAALGYGASPALVWSAPDWEHPACGQGKYGDEAREPWKCSALRYHEGPHIFDTPDPLCQHVYGEGFRAGQRCLRSRRDGDVHDLTDAWSATHEFIA